MRLIGILAFASGLALGSQNAAAQNVQWASKQADDAVVTSAAVHGQPDGIATAVGFYNSVYVRDFKAGKVGAVQLEKAMKLPAGELGKWDLIVFESEAPGSGAFFDGSMWMVQDMQKMVSTVYDSRTRASVPGTGSGWSFKTGRMTMAEFKAIYPGPRVMADAAWLLIKFPSVVEKTSPNLAVWMGGGPIPSPDDNMPTPDAIGVIR
ncbi:hypothetical protein [Sphingorhabdus sp.]|jgi:hypothetical protein|uniref:hypothetical protein n=1 Tax=Sphingorhabdus sp. TaxID=1902408 RepID=UPI002D1FBF2C|nr:hypothetical protein [Sphingorhabdus sp.]